MIIYEKVIILLSGKYSIQSVYIIPSASNTGVKYPFS